MSDSLRRAIPLVLALASFVAFNLHAQSPKTATGKGTATEQAAGLPQSPERKLIEADQIFAGFAAGEKRVKVAVMLTNPPEAEQHDWSKRAGLARVQSAVKARADAVLARLSADGFAIRHRFETFAGFSAEVSLNVLGQLLNDPDVVSIEPLHEVHAQTAQGIPLMKADVYRSTYDGTGVAAAVVDSGVDYTHPRLGGGGFPNRKVIGGYNFGEGTTNPAPYGRVLVAGGMQSGPSYTPPTTSSVDIYDPASGRWAGTGPLNCDRGAHAAPLLPSGQVFVTEGYPFATGPHAGTELYNPSTATWSVTSSGLWLIQQTATVLLDGTVLCAGGRDNMNIWSDPWWGWATIYHPASQSWSNTSSMYPHQTHTATLLPDGRVLVVGTVTADPSYAAQIRDPVSRRWSFTGTMRFLHASHTATLLTNGLVLVAGGWDDDGCSHATASAELFDPATGTWRVTGTMTTARFGATATLLPNGEVLVAGGLGEVFRGGAFTSAEIYDPATEAWRATGPLTIARSEHTASLLPNGQVIVAGGADSSPYTDYWYVHSSSSAELYDPATGTWTPTGSMSTERYWHTATLLPGNPHGTSCAGILAGDVGSTGDYVGGVAPGAKLYALKITAPDGTEFDDSIARSWEWCALHKDDYTKNPILVISTSQGGGRYLAPCDPESSPNMRMLSAAAHCATNAGITLVVSSGNDGYCDAISSPACFSQVIAVGAVFDAAIGDITSCVQAESCVSVPNSTGCPKTGYGVTDPATVADQVPSYSNLSTNLGLFAPADDSYTLSIVGLGNVGAGGYTTNFGGTSAACAYAAGAVASLQSAAKAILGRWLTPAEVREKLTSTGDKITDPKTTNPGMTTVTKPRINLARAIESLGTGGISITARMQANGLFHIAFTGTPGGRYTLLRSPDPTLPLNNWSELGLATETSPGQFQFIDLQTAAGQQFFYRVRSP